MGCQRNNQQSQNAVSGCGQKSEPPMVGGLGLRDGGSVMSERELFEQKFPVPKGIYWNESSTQYDALPGAAGFDDVESYHSQWQAWQAARAAPLYTHPQPAQQGSVPYETVRCLTRFLNEINKFEDEDRDYELEHHLDLALQALNATPQPAGDGCEFHGDDQEACATYSGQVPCDSIRALAGRGVEPVSWMVDDSLFWHERQAEIVAQRAGLDPQPLYTQPPAKPESVPEGWKLVPIEPTQEMRRKAGLTRGADFYTISQVWDAMLSATPQPEGDGVRSVDTKDLMIAADMLEDYASALDNGDLDGAGHCLPEAVRNMADTINPHKADATTPQPEGDGCEWHGDDNGTWMSACGKEWYFEDGGPEDNGMNYCVKCGKRCIEIGSSDDGSESHDSAM